MGLCGIDQRSADRARSGFELSVRRFDAPLLDRHAFELGLGVPVSLCGNWPISVFRSISFRLPVSSACQPSSRRFATIRALKRAGFPRCRAIGQTRGHEIAGQGSRRSRIGTSLVGRFASRLRDNRELGRLAGLSPAIARAERQIQPPSLVVALDLRVQIGEALIAVGQMQRQVLRFESHLRASRRGCAEPARGPASKTHPAACR